MSINVAHGMTICVTSSRRGLSNPVSRPLRSAWDLRRDWGTSANLLDFALPTCAFAPTRVQSGSVRLPLAFRAQESARFH